SIFVSLVIFGQTAAVFDIPFLMLILAAALVIVMPLTGAINLSIERVFYRPFRHASRLAPLITAVGVSFILQNAALVIVGAGDRGHPQVFPLTWTIPVGEAKISVLSIFVFALAISLMVALNLFVTK